MILCDPNAFLSATNICYDMTPAVPTLFSCVLKKGLSTDSWNLLPLDNGHLAPALLLDPHNQDLPAITLSNSQFDVSDAYCSRGPPKCIIMLLDSKQAAFSFDSKLDKVNSVNITINFNDFGLFTVPPRQIGPHKCCVIDESIRQLLDWNMIEPSSSRVGYPLVLVQQHDKWCFCVSYINLNLATVRQAYPMTGTDTVFDALYGNHVFSILDAARGYHQLPVAPSDRWKTVFITHKGLYQYKCIPFGLKNALIKFLSFLDSML